MPTTCGFPNCKFRSRYRGQEDNRHFYRIPKRPLVLRQRWLKAIGRTEETVVSQLRICSAHFEGGEKKEGDIPVPDPQLDSPLSIPLPPKESKSGDRRRCQKPYINQSNGSSTSSTETTLVSSCDRRRGGLFPTFNANLQSELSSLYSNSVTSKMAAAFDYPYNVAPRDVGNAIAGGMKPLIALLDGRDCSIEMPILRDIATVAFCDAQHTSEIHEKVLNEAIAAFMWNTIKLEKRDLEKFKALKLIICMSSDTSNVNVKAATELGIAVCNTPGLCTEEVADSTLSMILNLFRRTHWLARTMDEGKNLQANGIEQIRELSSGCRRIRSSTLGIVGLGQVGTAVMLRAKAFGFSIVFYDPFINESVEKVFAIERATSFEELLRRSDCVSFHCSLNPTSTNLLNEDTLEKLKSGAFIVNTSHPEIINESALVAALRSGRVKAAALDIQQIVDANCATQLSARGLIIQTARTSWLSEESTHELRVSAAKEMRRALTGRIPHDLNYCVNKEQLMARGTSATSVTSSASSFPSSTFNPLVSLGFGSDAYNMPLAPSFNSLPYANNLFNPLFMGNPAAASAAFGNFQLPIPSSLGVGSSPVTTSSPKRPPSTKRSASQNSNENSATNRSTSRTPTNPPASNGEVKTERESEDQNDAVAEESPVSKKLKIEEPSEATALNVNENEETH